MFFRRIHNRVSNDLRSSLQPSRRLIVIARRSFQSDTGMIKAVKINIEANVRV